MNIFDINLNLYRSFYYVAKYGGFTKASKYALISQSSLSSNIKNLESSLGVKLFDRKLSDVKLTRDGKELFSKLEEVINILSDNVEQKEINIGCLRFIADNYLDEIIKTFKEKNSNIKINFNFSNTTELYQMLKKDELDLILCRYPLFYKFEKYISVEKIKDVENVFVCSKKFYDDNLIIMDDDYTYPLILPDSSEKRRIIEQYLIDNGINYRVDIEIPNSNLLKKIILNDIGIGYINKKSIAKEIENDEVIILNKFKNIPLDNITIIYNSKRKSVVMNDFIKILKSIIGKTNN